jgi:hypothetical protein
MTSIWDWDRDTTYRGRTIVYEFKMNDKLIKLIISKVEKEEQPISLVKKVNLSMRRKIPSKRKKKSQMSFFFYFVFLKKGRMMTSTILFECRDV